MLRSIGRKGRALVVSLGFVVIGLAIMVAVIVVPSVAIIGFGKLPDWIAWAIIAGVVLVVAASWPAIVRWERREEAKKRLY